jgi:Protein of unknown function (DUF5672)
MKILNNITIVSINGRDPENSIKAIEYSCKFINFNKKLLITNKDLQHSEIEIIKTEGLNSIKEYNIFCVKELHKYIKTEYCLLVQPDGFVVNYENWTDEFLKYDYIGAPWDQMHTIDVLYKCNLPINESNCCIGNGGFSLRSKILLKECSNFEYDGILEEDVFICAKKRKELKEKGIKYPPFEIAERFSYEWLKTDKTKIKYNTFGFHGKHHQEYKNLLNS